MSRQGGRHTAKTTQHGRARVMGKKFFDSLKKNGIGAFMPFGGGAPAKAAYAGAAEHTRAASPTADSGDGAPADIFAADKRAPVSENGAKALMMIESGAIDGLSATLHVSDNYINRFLSAAPAAGIPYERKGDALLLHAREFHALRSANALCAGASAEAPAFVDKAAAALAAEDVSSAAGLYHELNAAIDAKRGDPAAIACALACEARARELLMSAEGYNEAALLYEDASLAAKDIKDAYYLYAEKAAQCCFRAGALSGDAGAPGAAAAVAAGMYNGFIPKMARDKHFTADMPRVITALSLALLSAGEAGGDTAQPEQAVQRLRHVANVYGDRLPPLFAGYVKHHLGRAQTLLGEREGEPSFLHDAVKNFQGALARRRRDTAPADWAASQHRMGDALATLGELEDNSPYLKAANSSFDAALQERTAERMPLHRADTLNRKGNALFSLAARESDISCLRAAAAAYKEALIYRTETAAPAERAVTQYNYGLTASAMAQREPESGHIQTARAAFEEAFTLFSAAGDGRADMAAQALQAVS